MNCEDLERDDDFFAGFDNQSFHIPPIGVIDKEAIAWALNKLTNFGVIQNTEENAMMADRLVAMLQS